jgi:hypothetical protein
MTGSSKEGTLRFHAYVTSELLGHEWQVSCSGPHYLSGEFTRSSSAKGLVGRTAEMAVMVTHHKKDCQINGTHSDVFKLLFVVTDKFRLL